MFGKQKLLMQKRIEQLEWLLCKGKHKWIEAGIETVQTKEGPQHIILIKCETCAKDGYKPLHMAEEPKMNPIGFRKE